MTYDSALRSFLPVFLLSFVALSPGCDAPEAKHMAAGNLHFKQGKYAAARTEYEAALAKNPKSAGAHILLGNAHFELGDLGSAQRQFEAALELDAKAIEAHRALAIVLFRTTLPGDAKTVQTILGHLEVVIAQNPKDRNAIVTAAQVLSEKADPIDADAFLKAQNQATEYLRRALEIDDKDPKTLFQVALVYARKKDPIAALSAAQRLEALSPGKGNGAYTTAIVYTLIGDLEEALASVEELLKLPRIAPDYVKKETYLEPLWNDPRFVRLVEAAARRKEAR
jgi:adenylate cyclase